MIILIRKLLSRNKHLYASASRFYHLVRFKCQKVYYNHVRNIEVYNPIDYDQAFYKSQFGQDFLLETVFFPNLKNGFFVEVGANDPVKNSNTYFFEKFRGWSGLSVDAIDFSAEYAKLRPNTEFVNAVISNTERMVDFNYVESETGWEDQMSGIGSTKLSGKGFKSNVKSVQAIRLESLIGTRKEIDFMIVDVEGHEVEVMSGVDLDTIRPHVIICENSGSLSEQRRLQKFMASKRYKLQARIWTADDVYVTE